MTWREAFLIRFGPGMFSGITLPLWLKMLRENHFSVDPPYWGRAASITCSSDDTCVAVDAGDVIVGTAYQRGTPSVTLGGAQADSATAETVDPPSNASAAHRMASASTWRTRT